MKLRNVRGFTLIELLVVIAIIGILSSVVLASLSSARGKGNTAAIRSTLVNVRTQAELVYAGDYSFATVCDDAVVLRARSELNDLNGGAGTICFDGASGWALATVIEDGALCVDADGTVKEYANIDATISDDNTYCN